MFTAIDQYSLVLNCTRVGLNYIFGRILQLISFYYIGLLKGFDLKKTHLPPFIDLDKFCQPARAIKILLP